ncbi:hypothetical protein N4X81_005035, partial [Salmonella enterica]|nr:hypothetical protein [Salmonella enterica]
TGTGSTYAQNLAEQRSGAGIERSIGSADTGEDLQSVSQDIVGAFKTRANELYGSSKRTAQALLDDFNVTQLKMPETKAIAKGHLDAHAETGVGLTAEARRTLANFQKAKINNIDTLDNWKRTLSEKANKAGRNGDYTSATALRETLDGLRNEADTVIHSIDPAAGSLYSESDQYFRQMAGDFGKNSSLSKIANTDNPIKAGNVLLGSDSLAGQFEGIRNTSSVIRALEDTNENGYLENSGELLDRLKAALGNASRDRAYAAGTRGENFSPPAFANNLSRTQFHSILADESNINSAIADATRTMRTQAKVGSTGKDVLGNLLARGVGAGVGMATHGPVGGLIGQELAGRTANVVPTLLDKLAGTANKSKAMIDFVSIPENAQKVADIITARGGNVEAATPEAVSKIVKTLTRFGTQSTVAATQPDNPLATYNQPTAIEQPIDNPLPEPQNAPEPEQQAQAAQAPDQDDDVATHLYRALSSAETGGIKNRFIRTKAEEAGLSTAYGPAQLTVSTAKDFYKRNPDLLNEQQKAYLQRFIEQGERMKKAPKNDPVFGYGKAGVMGDTKEDRHLYYEVAQTMLKKMIADNGGDLEKTMKQWRGNDKDTAYFNKVRKSWGKFNQPAQPVKGRQNKQQADLAYIRSRGE